MESYIKNFKQIIKRSVHEAGGKGTSLGEMMNTQIPVTSWLCGAGFCF